jgi:hypothetical protein
MRILGLLAFPYLIGLFYMGWIASPWWTPIVVALAGTVLYFSLPGRAQHLDRELYSYDADRVGLVAAILRRPSGFFGLISSCYVAQIITAAIPYAIGLGIGALLRN